MTTVVTPVVELDPSVVVHEQRNLGVRDAVVVKVLGVVDVAVEGGGGQGAWGENSGGRSRVVGVGGGEG